MSNVIRSLGEDGEDGSAVQTNLFWCIDRSGSVANRFGDRRLFLQRADVARAGYLHPDLLPRTIYVLGLYDRRRKLRPSRSRRRVAAEEPLKILRPGVPNMQL